MGLGWGQSDGVSARLALLCRRSGGRERQRQRPGRSARFELVHQSHWTLSDDAGAGATRSLPGAAARPELHVDRGRRQAERGQPRVHDQGRGWAALHDQVRRRRAGAARHRCGRGRLAHLSRRGLLRALQRDRLLQSIQEIFRVPLHRPDQGFPFRTRHRTMPTSVPARLFFSNVVSNIRFATIVFSRSFSRRRPDTSRSVSCPPAPANCRPPPPSSRSAVPAPAPPVPPPCSVPPGSPR